MAMLDNPSDLNRVNKVELKVWNSKANDQPTESALDYGTAKSSPSNIQRQANADSSNSIFKTP